MKLAEEDVVLIMVLVAILSAAVLISFSRTIRWIAYYRYKTKVKQHEQQAKNVHEYLHGEDSNGR